MDAWLHGNNGLLARAAGAVYHTTGFSRTAVEAPGMVEVGNSSGHRKQPSTKKMAIEGVGGQ